MSKAGWRDRLTAAALAAAFALGAPGAIAQPAPGDAAPRWTLPDLDGQPVNFPDVSAGRPVILMFWGTWCPYCKALMPRLAALKHEFADARLEVYMVDFAERGDPTPAIREMDLPVVFVSRGARVARQYRVNIVPALFIVEDGRIVYALDYPPDDHPSQQVAGGARQAALLAPWWEERIRSVLIERQQ
ncbi:MAG: TlpA family protein disulfide reductase [Xanthomonadaceae bacterium]|nr:TlpA family protein disulfide reductase [Xanthomonadaceae bacterium]